MLTGSFSGLVGSEPPNENFYKFQKKHQILHQLITNSFISSRLVEIWVPWSNYLTPDNSNNVINWKGAKQGLTWLQATPASRPLISTFRGVPCLAFDGVNDVLSLTSSLDLTNNVGEYTIGAVYVWPIVPTTTRPVFYISTPTASSPRLMLEGGRTSGMEGTSFRRLDNDTVTNQTQGAIIPNISTVKLVSVNWISRITSVSVNGNFYTGTPSSTAGNTSATNSAVINLGSGTTTFFQGNLMAAIAIRAALNQQEHNKLSGILAWLTNSQTSLIPSHPFDNFPPLKLY